MSSENFSILATDKFDVTFDDIDLMGTQQTASFGLTLSDGTQLEKTVSITFENLCSDPIRV